MVFGGIWALRNGCNVLVGFSSHRSHLDHNVYTSEAMSLSTITVNVENVM